MAKFKYAITTPSGEQLVGTTTGSSVQGVTESLTRQGMEVRLVKPEGTRAESTEVYLIGKGFAAR